MAMVVVVVIIANTLFGLFDDILEWWQSRLWVQINPANGLYLQSLWYPHFISVIPHSAYYLTLILDHILIVILIICRCARRSDATSEGESVMLNRSLWFWDLAFFVKSQLQLAASH